MFNYAALTNFRALYQFYGKYKFKFIDTVFNYPVTLKAIVYFLKVLRFYSSNIGKVIQAI